MPGSAAVLSHDQIKDIFGKIDDNAAEHRHKTLCALAGIMALECQTDLYNTKAQQDRADRANGTEHKTGQVVDGK